MNVCIYWPVLLFEVVFLFILCNYIIYDVCVLLGQAWIGWVLRRKGLIGKVGRMFFSDNRKKCVNGFGDAEIKPGKSVCSLTARTSGFTRNHPSTEGVGDLIAESVGPQSEVTVGGLSDDVDHAEVEVVAEEFAVGLLAGGWVCAQCLIEWVGCYQ